MRKQSKRLMLAVLMAVYTVLTAQATSVVSGPKGGRLLNTGNPKAEFYVEKDRTVTITFYDTGLKPVPAEDQRVTVIADTKSGKQTLELGKRGNVLASKTTLPEGDGYNLVVQVRATPQSKPQNFRFKYEAHNCSGCARVEYACGCH